VDSFDGIGLTVRGFDFLDEAVSKLEHPRELDFGHTVRRVVFVATRRLVFVVVAQDDTSSVTIAVVERVPSAGRELRVVRSVDLHPRDGRRGSLLPVFDDPERHFITVYYGTRATALKV
jgi:hypothetical protein